VNLERGMQDNELQQELMSFVIRHVREIVNIIFVFLAKKIQGVNEHKNCLQ
jgi:hypothetical protein